MPTARVGADIDAYCGHCGLELAHVVVAMTGAKPVRVQCKTCKAVHGFRHQAGSIKLPHKVEANRVGEKRKVRTTEHRLDELLTGRDLKAAKTYQMAICFAPNDLVRHANFGLGVVVGKPTGDKVEILFPCGLKVLAHARAVDEKPASRA